MSTIKIAEELQETIGPENSRSLVDMFRRVIERARERRSQQRVEVVFNEKGHVRHINGSDNVNGYTPKTYNAE